MYPDFSDEILGISARIVSLYTDRGLFLCGAESCTGGACASAIVATPGASRIFRGSAVCYCDGAKEKILGVKASTIEKFFAESSRCAEEMAFGALGLYEADIAFATTGFLDANVGGKPESLRGIVFAAIAMRGRREALVTRISLDPSNERNFNRLYCVLEVMKMIEKAAL